MRKLLVLVSLSALAAAAAAGGEGGRPPLAGAPQKVTVEGHGGWKLDGFYAAPAAGAAGVKAPAVILTHMLNRSKEDWMPLVPRLTAAGYAVVAYDVRGHGRCVHAAGKSSSWKDFKADDWEAAEKDIARVREWLLANKASVVDAGRIALMGASIGANLSLRALTDQPELRGAVLLSAGLDYRGVRTEAAAGKLGGGQRVAVLATAEDSDGHCAKTAEALLKAGTGRVFLKKVYSGAEHGTRMFGAVEGVEDDIMEALKQIVPAPKPGTKDEKPKDDVKDALDLVL